MIDCVREVLLKRSLPAVRDKRGILSQKPRDRLFVASSKTPPLLWMTKNGLSCLLASRFSSLASSYSLRETLLSLIMSYMPFSQDFSRFSANKHSTFAICVLVAFVAFLSGLGVGLGDRASGDIGSSSVQKGTWADLTSHVPSDIDSSLDLDQFWNVWEDVKVRYKEPISDKDLFYGALQGLAESAKDPYTTYFVPEDAKTFEDDLKGEFSGIGAEIGYKNDQLQVIAPLSDSPAERAGVRAGDLIMEIDGVESLTMPTEEAVNRIRGEKGTEVTLKMGRSTKEKVSGYTKIDPIEIKIVRDMIVVKSVEWKEMGNGIFRIDVRSFNEDTAVAFGKAVDEIIAKNGKKLIIDLRNNPGGFLDRAVSMLGEWLPGEDVVLQRRQGEIIQRYKGDGTGRLKGIPTVVLINGGSASASEIVAGALQDYKAATVVGMKSFGKGTVQDYINYGDGSAMKITISEWLTPLERSIQKEGIAPDVEVDLTNEDYNADRDPQIDKAIEILKSK